jgi:membrane fusion protein (multidrug efflux system)
VSNARSKSVAARTAAVVVVVAQALAACNQGPPTGAGPPGSGGGPPPWARGGAGGSPGGAPVTVITRKIEPRSFTDRFTALGTARANEAIEVTSRTASVVTRINFKEGQRVPAGQVLVELDTRQESANVSLAEAQLQQAQSQYDRSKALAQTMAVSQADLDRLQADLLVARAQLRGAQARLDTLIVRAPFAGKVGLRRVSLGDLVGPDTVITTLDDTSIMKLEFGVPEAYLADLEVGMTIQAESAVYADRRFTGTVRTIDSRVDAVTRSVTVIATVANADGALKPGMFLSTALEQTRTNVLLVPEEALVPREGRQFVFVVEDGQAREREVALGGRAPGYAEVRSGLTAGTLVITEGTQRVRDGAAVATAPAG